MEKSNKVQIIHGLSNFHIAILNSDTKEVLEYGEVQSVEGAVAMSITPNEEQTPKYADNGVFAMLGQVSDLDATMTMIDLPASIRKEIYGNKETNGVKFSNKADVKKEIALGFQAEKHGGGTRFYWMLRGMPSIAPIEHGTDEGTVEPKDMEVGIKFMALQNNGNYKAELDSDEVTSKQWFADVVATEKDAEALTVTP